MRKNTKRIIALILMLGVLTSLSGCALVDAAKAQLEVWFGAAPEVTEAGDAQKAAMTASDAEEAAECLAEYGREQGYQNAMEELTEKNTAEVGGDSYYRLQQNYKDIPVYGRTVTFVTDGEGDMTVLTGNVVDVDEDLELTPTVSQTQIDDAIREWFTENGAELDEENLEAATISDEDLCVYIDDGESHLAYQLDIAGCELVLDAHEGEILHATLTIMESGLTEVEQVTGYTASDTDRANGFPAEKRGEYYYVMSDASRGLIVYTFDSNISYENDVFYRDRSSLVESTDNIFGNTEAESALEYEKGAKLLQNVIEIYEFYEDLDFESPMDTIRLYYNDGYDNGGNALGGTVDGAGAISMGYDTGVECLDVIAHEFTHFVSRNIVAWNGLDENGALNEAMSDIFGELIEAEVAGRKIDWQMSKYRNIADPAAGGYPVKASDPNNSGEDYSHGYSTVVSHAAYLMWNGIDGDPDKELTEDELAELWYRAMLMMPSDCDFAMCRKTVEWAAQSMENLEAEQIECIGEAFDRAGISSIESTLNNCDYTLTPDSTITVYDRDGKLHSGYTLAIVDISAYVNYASSGLINDSWTGYRTERQIGEPGPQELELEAGYYHIIVTDPDFPEFEYRLLAEVKADGTDDSIVLETAFAGEQEQALPQGKTAISYRSKIYYWSRSMGSGTEYYTLTAEDMDGTTTELLRSSSQGELYIVGNYLFVNQQSSNYTDYWIQRISLLNASSTSIDGMNVRGADETTELLILYDYNGGTNAYYAYDAADGTSEQITAIPDDTYFVAAGHGAAYFTKNTHDGEGLILMRYDLRTKNNEEISSARAEYSEYVRPGSGYSYCDIHCFQETDEAIYYIYGFLGGTGHYFQRGGLVRVDKDGYNSQLLASASDSPTYSGPVLYAFERDGQEYVAYYEDGAGMLMNAATGEKQAADMLIGSIGEPFAVPTENGTQYWIYTEADGKEEKILSSIYTGAVGEESWACYADNVVYAGEYIVYELVYQKENPNPTSWRDYTVVYKREVYVYRSVVNETKLVSTVEYSG